MCMSSDWTLAPCIYIGILHLHLTLASYTCISHLHHICTLHLHHICILHLHLQALWRKLEEEGHIDLGAYEGWYSVRDECFYQVNVNVNVNVHVNVRGVVFCEGRMLLPGKCNCKCKCKCKCTRGGIL